jgi:GGDEF domain-containing protein
MRKVIYDNIIRQGIAKLEGNEDFTSIELRDAFKKILEMPEGEELDNVYARMDNFFGANNTFGTELVDITLISVKELFRGEIK